MTFEAAMGDFLEATLSVGENVHASRLPQGAELPALVFALTPGEGPLVSHDGDVGVTAIRCQFDCWGQTYDDAVALAAELRREVSGRRFTWGAYEVGHVLLDGGLDDDDPKTGNHRRIVQADIQYSGGVDGS